MQRCRESHPVSAHLGREPPHDDGLYVELVPFDEGYEAAGTERVRGGASLRCGS